MFTGLSNTPTAEQQPGGKREKTMFIYGDFGASGQVQLQFKGSNGQWVAFSTLTWTENSERLVRFPGRPWRIVPIDCVDVSVDFV